MRIALPYSASPRSILGFAQRSRNVRKRIPLRTVSAGRLQASADMITFKVAGGIAINLMCGKARTIGRC